MGGGCNGGRGTFGGKGDRLAGLDVDRFCSI